MIINIQWLDSIQGVSLPDWLGKIEQEVQPKGTPASAQCFGIEVNIYVLPACGYLVFKEL